MKKGFVWSVSGVGVNTVGALIVTPALVRGLGPSVYGVYVLVMAISSYAGFLDLGLGWAAGRFFSQDLAAQNIGRLRQRLSSMSLLFALVGLLAVAGSLAVGPTLVRHAGAVSRDSRGCLALSGLAFACSLQAGLLGSLLRADNRFGAAQAPPVLGSFCVLTGSYVVVTSGGGLLPLIALNAAVNLLVLIAVLGLSYQVFGGNLWELRCSWHPLGEMAAFGGWSTVSRLIVMLMLQVDRLAVSLVGSVTGLTYYAVPANLASRVNVVGGTAASLFYARASQLAARGSWKQLSGQHAVATRLLTAVALSVAVPLCVLGPRFLRVWIGPEMARLGGPILIPLVLGYAVNSVSSVDAVTLEGCGRPDLTAKVMLAWALPTGLAALVASGYVGYAAIAYGVAVWLGGTGATIAVICRVRLAAFDAGRERWTFWLTVAGLAFVGWLCGTTLVPFVTNVQRGLAALAVNGTVLLFGAYCLLLPRSERRWILRRGPLELAAE